LATATRWFRIVALMDSGPKPLQYYTRRNSTPPL